MTASSPRRAHVVWTVFGAAMTVACGLLLLADGSLRSISGAPLLGPALILQESASPGLFETEVPVDGSRWRGIVIHHSGSPAGDPETLHRLHQGLGLDGLGYHFVIGNGNGLDDGVVHVGYRWTAQMPGAHAIGPDQSWHNEHSIAICLIGNGEVRAFTNRQMRALESVVRDLQDRFDISADRVRLHRDIAEVRSPGRFFAEAAFRHRLAG